MAVCVYLECICILKAGLNIFLTIETLNSLVLKHRNESNVHKRIHTNTHTVYIDWLNILYLNVHMHV